MDRSGAALVASLVAFALIPALGVVTGARAPGSDVEVALVVVIGGVALMASELIAARGRARRHAPAGPETDGGMERNDE